MNCYCEYPDDDDCCDYLNSMPNIFSHDPLFLDLVLILELLGPKKGEDILVLEREDERLRFTLSKLHFVTMARVERFKSLHNALGIAHIFTFLR